MSKPDVNFTIGADGSAFVGSMGKIQDSLNKIGQAFMGLQGVAAGVRTADTTPFQTAPAPSCPRRVLLHVGNGHSSPRVKGEIK